MNMLRSTHTDDPSSALMAAPFARNIAPGRPDVTVLFLKTQPLMCAAPPGCTCTAAPVNATWFEIFMFCRYNTEPRCSKNQRVVEGDLKMYQLVDCMTNG